MRIMSIVPLVAVAASVAFCGFHPQPMSGTVACTVGGAACCPTDYVCVGRGAITADGLSDEKGTCWSKQDLPPEALSATHDYTTNVLDDPACLVTDWLPPSMSLPDGGLPGAGGRVVGGGGEGGGLGSSLTTDASSSTVPPTRGMFDPSIVYITLLQGTGQLAERRIFNPSDVSKSWFTLPEHTMGVIRPTDGALIYANYLDLSSFSTLADAVVMYQFAPDKPNTDSAFASDNDINYPLPSCTSTADYQFWLGIAPDTGDILTKCGFIFTYLGSGNRLQNGVFDVYAIGYGGRHFLGADGWYTNYILNPDGTQVGVIGGPGNIADVRATATGFWILQQIPKSANLDRWHVLYDGTISEHVSYPPNPIAANNSVPYLDYRLDGLGRAVVVMIVADDTAVIDMDTARYVVLRFDPNAASGEVLLDLAKHPDLHYTPFDNALITGP